MTYLFHEPVRVLVPGRPNAMSPSVALAIAILSTTLATVALAALMR
jgi:hypothetical protein